MKGHVERSVEYVRRKAFARKDLFDTIPLAQEYLEEICMKLNGKQLTGSSFTIGELMNEERDLLLPHPGRMECFLLQEASICKYSTFSLGKNHYSVPDYLVGQKVDVKVYANQLKVYHQGVVLCTHQRHYGSGQWIITLDHYLRTLERKPGALHGSAALKQAPWEVRDIYQAAFQGNARDFIELLQYCQKNKISHEQLWKVYQQLLVTCPSDISVDKFKVLLGNDPQGLVSPIPTRILPGWPSNNSWRLRKCFKRIRPWKEISHRTLWSTARNFACRPSGRITKHQPLKPPVII